MWLLITTAVIDAIVSNKNQCILWNESRCVLKILSKSYDKAIFSKNFHHRCLIHLCKRTTLQGMWVLAESAKLLALHAHVPTYFACLRARC